MFLLSLAIVDDIGAIVVIAFFYADSVELGALGVGIGLVVVVALLKRAEVIWVPAYAVLGVGVWVAVYQSGVTRQSPGRCSGSWRPPSTRW